MVSFDHGCRVPESIRLGEQPSYSQAVRVPAGYDTILITAGADLREGFGAFQQSWGMRVESPVITLALPGALVELEAVAAVPPRG
jgi:hypothetical protein